MYYCRPLKIVLLVWTCVSASDLTHLRCPPTSDCSIAQPTDWANTQALFHLSNEATLSVQIKESEIIYYTCHIGDQIGSGGYFKYFPTFDRIQNVKRVKLSNCGLPQKPYRLTLDALNVTGYHDLSLVFNSIDQKTLLPPDLFVGLDLLTLRVTCYLYQIDVNFDFDFLRQLQRLKNLELKGVTVPPFPSWNQLNAITITASTPLNMIQHWGGCQVLKELKIKDWNVSELPDSWLANCSRLTSVHIEWIKTLKNLPHNMFNSIYLRTMKVIDCSLQNLPNDFFKNTVNLRTLDLSNNNLQVIASDTFVSIAHLEELVLKRNRMLEISIVALETLQSLKTLQLDNNFRYLTCDYQDRGFLAGNRDDRVCFFLYLPQNVHFKVCRDYVIVVFIANTLKACGFCVTGVWKRQWPLLASLERLSLDSCYATICSYWNQSMPKLKQLNLARSGITELKYQDIELIRSSGWDVDLSYSLKAIVLTERDYENILQTRPAPTNATIRFDNELTVCDCSWYWFARTLKEFPGYLSLQDLLCFQKWEQYTDPVPLEWMTLDSFVCKDEDCERSCECYTRAPDNTTQMICTGAGLDHIPRMPFLRKVHMAYNNIKAIHADDLPETLEYMDLQNNQLTTLGAEVALMMFNRSTTIYNLEKNHFICNCSSSGLINLLQTHQNQLENYENLICADESLLQHANTFVLCLKEHAPVIVGVISAITILCFMVMVLYYRYKTQIFIILYARGWCACCVNEQELDKDKMYDVFISFAHEDTNFVMDEFLPELEKKPHAFTVCVHHRDWMPGEWIPTQISHSVQQSRRTVIVLSRNFLSSVWALLEFRTAHIQAMKDGRVRLIIVLLGDVITDEGMDDELRAYLTTNTYIKWGDPRFWDKLRYALPHRGRDEGRTRAGGEEVLRLVRPTDPPIVLRNDVSPRMLAIEPARSQK